MEKESLYIYKLDAQGNKVKFPNDTYPAKLGEYTYTAQRMAGTPTLTATLNYPTCLDDEWTHSEFVEFRGEKYYVDQVPTSSKDGKSIMYKHEIQFVSERIALENIYFLDVVTEGDDTYHSNSTSIKFMGDIHEFVSRINASMKKSGLDYSVSIDEGITTEPKLVLLEDVYLASALQEIYSTYELNYYFVGKVCHVGYTENVIQEPFEYRNGLVSIKKANANYRIVNRATGVGSSDNIPFYYPNDSEHAEVQFTTDWTGDDLIIDPDVIRSYVNTSLNGLKFTYYDKRRYVKFSTGNATFLENNYLSSFDSYSIVANIAGTNISRLQLDKTFSSNVNIGNCDGILLPAKGYTTVTLKDKEIWNGFISFTALEYKVESDSRVKHEIQGNNLLLKSPYTVEEVGFPNYHTVKVICKSRITIENISLGSPYTLKRLLEVLKITTTLSYDKDGPINSGYGKYFKYDENKRVDYNNSGIYNVPDSMYVEPFNIYFTEEDSLKIPYIGTLMPSIYRKSLGEERFYNAINETYKIPGTSDFYSFNNPYTSNNAKEISVDFNDIRPTIEGVKNASGQLFGEIADIAFDQNDNDEFGTGAENNVFTGTDEYVHSYFYIKLHVYNGDYGFNLFEHGLAGSTAVINMTSGNCAACEFEIGVTYKDSEPKRAFNPVLVDSNGNLPAGDFEQKVTSQTSQYVERQQDTSANEVWIAVKKDNTSFGVVMPNATKNYRPEKGDKFVITGISLPKPYILAAEKRLDDAIIKYMSENNDEKFSFDLKLSRIYLAEHESIANMLNENARVFIKYNGHEHLLYVSSFTCKADDKCLYDISIELSENLSVSQSQLRNTISEIVGDMVSGNNAKYYDVLGAGAKHFIRKDVSDTTPFDLGVRKLTTENGSHSYDYEQGESGYSIYKDLKGTWHMEIDSLDRIIEIFVKSAIYLGEYKEGYSGGKIDSTGVSELLSMILRGDLTSDNFTPGALGGGYGILKKNADGRSYIEVDEIYVRMKAYFDSLEIKHVKHVGGSLILSPAGMKVTKVENITNGIIMDSAGEYVFDFEGNPVEEKDSAGNVQVYRLYFKNSDSDTVVVNEFKVGDLAYCKEFNIKVGDSSEVQNQFYWRFVQSVGDDYIDVINLSGGYAEGSTSPKAGDDVVTLGSMADPTRQNAVIITAFGEGSPSITQYAGINKFSLDNKVVTRISPDGNLFTGDFVIKTGENVQTLFELLNGKITSTVEDVSDLGTRVSTVEQTAESISSRVEEVNTELSSEITQTAKDVTISITDGLKETGINIETGLVQVKSNNFEVINNEGNVTAHVNADGLLNVNEGKIGSWNITNGGYLETYYNNYSIRLSASDKFLSVEKNGRDYFTIRLEDSDPIISISNDSTGVTISPIAMQYANSNFIMKNDGLYYIKNTSSGESEHKVGVDGSGYLYLE